MNIINWTTPWNESARLIYYNEHEESVGRRAAEIVMLTLLYLLLFIPFMMCMKTVLKVLRERGYLTRSEEVTLAESVDEGARAIDMVRLAGNPHYKIPMNKMTTV